MLSIMIASIVTVIVGFLVIKRYKAQAVLFIGGLFLMACAVVLMDAQILDAKKTTGWIWFDLFKYIADLFSTRTAGIGLMIMSVGGFARYMDKIGASKTLVKLVIKPLQLLKSPYLVLGLGYIVGQILNIFIPSASGLGLLLMVTLYPILIGLGVSQAAATAMIGTAACLDLGPASGNAVLAAKNGGIDVAEYFVTYQIPIAIAVMITISISHMLIQKWFDRKSGELRNEEEIARLISQEEAEETPPFYYIFLPLLPLLLILTFSNLVIASVKMDVVTAMIISVFISMFFELMRTRNLKSVLQSIQIFFDGMGSQFAVVITLVVAGEVFAKGLTSIGAINTIIEFAYSSGFGVTGMIFVMTGVIAVASIVMGSGNAPFFAFAALAPEISDKLGANPIAILLPMQFAAGIARSVSPITAVIVAVCGVSNQAPIEIVKRTAVPMALALTVTMIGVFFII